MHPGDSPLRSADLLAHTGWARRLAHGLVKDESAADDIVQASWLAALLHPPREELPLRPWLGAVVRNAARMRARSAIRRKQREQRTELETDAVPSAETVLLRRESERL